ncbi:MAG: D-alanine--D-alanine ligase [Gammaproteobacteria bacterium]
MSTFTNVAVLMGGDSAERAISLESGNAVLAALRRKGVHATPVDLDAHVLERLRSDGYDCAFIALHGRGGEDGQIQGALETLRIPYTGSGVLGSALAMDKIRAKRVWIGAGLPTPSFVELKEGSDAQAVVSALGLPIMVKPACEGSSIGASKVENPEGLSAAWKSAAEFDESIIAEQWITGREYTVAVLHEEALPMIRLETPRLFYDYEAKYHDDRTRYICPAELPAEREREYQALAVRAFQTLGAHSWGRVDMLVDRADRPWLIEVNTVPGMTSHSLVPMAAKAASISFDDLVMMILQTARLRRIVNGPKNGVVA